MEAIKATYSQYCKTATKKQGLVDVYLIFVMSVGITLAVYALLSGCHPWNAFAASFGSAVGSFVLGVNLRMQVISKGERNGQTVLDNFIAGLFLFLTVAYFIG